MLPFDDTELGWGQASPSTDVSFAFAHRMVAFDRGQFWARQRVEIMAIARDRGKTRTTPVDGLVNALVAGDRVTAERFVAADHGPGVTRSAVISDLLQPALERIGELWYEGAVGVADEHRATGIVEDVLAGLPPTPSQHPVASGARCLLAAVGNERHVLGLRALRLVLEDDGWACEYLGAMTPVAELVRLNGSLRTDVVLLSASYEPDTHELAGAVRQLKYQGSRVLVGGVAIAAAAGLWKRLGADGYGPDARVAQHLARRLCRP
jgi:MerR family transcriptional regulator, light-induced transcriptional regulator